MSDSKLEIKIPEQLITDTIRMEIVRQMPDKEKFAEQIIKAAMIEKKDNYSNSSIFQDAVSIMIRNEAKKIFVDWLELNKELIKTKLLEHLRTNSGSKLDKIVNQMVDGMGQWRTEVRFKYLEFVEEE